MKSNLKAKTADPLVRQNALSEELGQSRTTLWRWTTSGYLPKPVKIGRTSGWPRSVIDAWKVQQGWPEPATSSANDD